MSRSSAELKERGVRTQLLVTIAAICPVSATADADTAKAKAANTGDYKPAEAVAVPFEPLWVTSVTASSTFPHKRNAYAPTLVLDPKQTYIKATGDYRIDSAWCEGKPDEGIGESVTVTFERPTKIQTMTIKAGVWKTQKLFDANNIITGLEVITNDGRPGGTVSPDRNSDTAGQVEVKVPDPVALTPLPGARTAPADTRTRCPNFARETRERGSVHW
jgi:hypothetical protein